MKLTLNILTATLASFLFQEAFAGASAVVKACLKWEGEVPTDKTYVYFSPGKYRDHCMNKRGTQSRALIEQKGWNCASVGVVEIKYSSTGGDFCLTDDHIWTLTANIGIYEFTMVTYWFQDGPWVDIKPQGSWDAYDMICGRDQSEEECSNKGRRYQNWPSNEVGEITAVFVRGAGTSDFAALWNSTSVEQNENQRLREQTPELELK